MGVRCIQAPADEKMNLDGALKNDANDPAAKTRRNNGF